MPIPYSTGLVNNNDVYYIYSIVLWLVNKSSQTLKATRSLQMTLFWGVPFLSLVKLWVFRLAQKDLNFMLKLDRQTTAIKRGSQLSQELNPSLPFPAMLLMLLWIVMVFIIVPMVVVQMLPDERVRLHSAVEVHLWHVHVIPERKIKW